MKKRLFYLDFIRVVAVLAVFGCHFTRELEYSGVGFTTKILPDYIFNVYMGSFGVGLFFIASGASLMYVYQDGIQIGKFFKKRFIAIYPMFWLAYIAAFLYDFYLYKGVNLQYPISRFVLTVLGMDGYLGFYFPNYYLLGEWFLGCLIILYLLFPLLFFGVKKYPVITALIAGAIFAAGSFWSFHNAYIMPPECWFFMRIPEVLFGMYYIEYIRKVRWPILVLSLVILISLQSAEIILAGQVQILKTVPVCVAAFLVLSFVSDFVKGRLFVSFCKLIGKYSYAIFLSHHFIMRKFFPHFYGVVLQRGGVLILFFLTIAVVGVAVVLLYKLNSKILQLLNQREGKVI